MNTEQHARLGQQVVALIEDLEKDAGDSPLADGIIASEVRALVEMYRGMYE